MPGIRKYPPVYGEQYFSDVGDFLGGVTLEPQICSLKILLHGAEPTPLSSWQHATDPSKIDAGAIYQTLLTSPLSGDLDFAGHKAINLLLEILAADPSTTSPGQVWYRSDLEKPSLRRSSVTDRLVLENLAATLVNKTLTIPVIADFSNAMHSHHDNAGGGALDVASIGSGRFPFSRMPAAASGFLRGKGAGADPGYETLLATDIPSLDASKISSGRFGLARMPDGSSGFMKSQGLGVDPAYTAVDWTDVANKPSTFPPSAHEHNASDITAGILDEAIGGLGKVADLTGLGNDCILVYKTDGDKFVVESKPSGGGGGGTPGWQNCVCYPFAGTAVLSADPLYTYTSEVSESAGSYAEVAYFDFNMPAGTIKSIFANLVWACKITGSGNGFTKWELSGGSHAAPDGWVAITDEITQTNTVYDDFARSGVLHKITGLTPSTPFTVRCLVKKGTATSCEGKIKSNTYFRVTYKVT